MRLQDYALAGADAVSGALGLLRRPFSAEAMIARARRANGLSDFGDESFVEPMRRLLHSCASEADLSLVGRLATQWDVNRFLSNLLRMRAAELARPEIAGERIERPVFITGLPRTGTSFLHTLLMQDPANAVPRVWQTIHPYPQPSTTRRGRDRRVEIVDRQLRAFRRLAPEFGGLHPIEATSPQECSELTAHVFASLRFDTNYNVPSYRDWLDRTGHVQAYGFHKRFLRHLQHQARLEGRPAGRWVLKCPDHVFALEAIRTVYPDARIVFVHRDPLKVLASVARLTEVVRRPFTRRVDPHQLGRQESRRWHEGAERMVAAADGAGFEAPVFHVHYLDLVRDPLRTVRALYAHFDLDLGAQAAEAIQRRVRERPNGGYAAHHYRFADHGLDPAEERARFARYMAHFDITPEVGEDLVGPAGAQRRWASVAVPAPAAR